MTTDEAHTSTNVLQLNQSLVSGIIEGTNLGLQMTGVEPIPIGATAFSPTPSDISVTVGLIGRSNGSLTLNLSKQAMFYLTGQLLCEQVNEESEDVYDAVMEIGNMVGGCVKDILAESEFQLTHISVPSLIMGSNYNVYFSRGITNVSIIFEMPEFKTVAESSRYFTVTVSLLRQIA
ncbi:MAG: CheY-specific phosphatase CheX [Planctomycetota bacterium]|jgi:CheY-specific phosphatase CheX